MFGLAYVLIPSKFNSLQAALDKTLAPFKRGGEGDFPRAKLTFDDASDQLLRLHRKPFQYNADGSLTWSDGDPSYDSYGLSVLALREHLKACRLDRFEGTFAEIEPDFDAFVRRFTRYEKRDPSTGRYGRWLNPIGQWDWWDLGGPFDGAITGERRPAAATPPISSGPSSGRAIMENLARRLALRMRPKRRKSKRT